MAARPSPACRALALPLLALATLVPLHGLSAAGRTDPDPFPGQYDAYNRGVRAWNAAQQETDPRRRAKKLETAGLAFERAASVTWFPEAELARGLYYYSENRPYHAERQFMEVARTSRGALRAEALTYAGVLAMRRRDWNVARKFFDEAMAEDLATSTTSARGKDREVVLQALRDRAARLSGIQRVGSVMALQSQLHIDRPGYLFPTDGSYRALTAEVDRLLTPADLEAAAQIFNGRDAALIRFPERPNWRLPASAPIPEGAVSVTPTEVAASTRTWAAMAMANDPTQPIPVVEGLAEADRPNLMAGQIRRLLRLEGQGEYAQALALLDQMAANPDLALTVRQHRIWIRMEGMPDLAEATRLVDAEGGVNDPLYPDQQFALGQMYLSAGNPAEAEKRFRLALAPAPGTGGVLTAQQASQRYIRPLVEWNLGAVALNHPAGQDDPNRWKLALEALPTLASQPQREELRLFLAMRYAEAAMRAGQPEQVAEALKAAEQITSGQGTVAMTPMRNLDLRLFRRNLAALAFDRNEYDRYKDGFLASTDYTAERLAWEAAEMYRSTKPQTAEAFAPIREKLQSAQAFVGDNDYIKDRTAEDLGAIDRFNRDYEAYAVREQERADRFAFLPRYNSAVSETNSARWASDWLRAAKIWEEVIAMPGARPEERSEAGTHLVKAHLRRGDLYYANNQPDQARLAYREAREALASLPVPPSNPYLADRVAGNVAAMDVTVVKVAGWRSADAPMHMQYPASGKPSVTGWLNHVKQNEAAKEKLAGWYRRHGGPPEIRTTDEPEAVIRHVEENARPAAPIRTAKGQTIVRARVADPVAPVQVELIQNRPIPTLDRAEHISGGVPEALPRPAAPPVDYSRPQAAFDFPKYGYFAYPTPAVDVPIITGQFPALTLQVWPREMPPVRADRD